MLSSLGPATEDSAKGVETKLWKDEALTGALTVGTTVGGTEPLVDTGNSAEEVLCS